MGVDRASFQECENSMTSTAASESVSEEFQDLLLDHQDISGFLNDFTRMLADRISEGGEEIWCALTLLRPRKMGTVASSSPRAEALDEIQFEFGDGPCLTAAREHKLVHVPDMREENRWPEYKDAAAENGIRSVLGVPFELQGEANSGLNVYSEQPHRYDEANIRQVQQEVLLASKALHLAIRLAAHRDREADMEAAMGSRTNIDLAIGIIMGQNKCSQDEAANILKSASNSRNIKLRDLAAATVESTGGPAKTHFDS